MSLFRRKKKSEQEDGGDPTTDDGIIGLYYSIMDRVDADFQDATIAHLERLHEPGGYAREKQRADFVDLGMRRRDYIDALDDIEFTAHDNICIPQIPIRKRGGAVVVTRWTVRGTHNRPIGAVPPSGAPVTIDGLTYTTFRNYNLGLEYSYWGIGDLAQRMLER